MRPAPVVAIVGKKIVLSINMISSCFGESNEKGFPPGIREALTSFARQVGRGEWMLKEDFRDENVRRLHTKMIAILAEIGIKKGYGIWIGRREQRDRLAEAFPRRQGQLRDYVTIRSLVDFPDIASTRDAELVDLLWIQDKYIVAAFEVEVTTSMTESLKRCSNLSPSVPKHLVIPEEREDQLTRKFESPLFFERFRSDSWGVIFAEVLESAFMRQGADLDVQALIDQKPTKRSQSGIKDKRQLRLFRDEEGR